MSGAISDFRSVLDQLQSVKPPGVSGSRIRKLVDFVVQNPDLHAEVVAALAEHTARSPASHKLGSMYVIDAIARAYQEEAKKPQGKSGAALGLEGIRSQLPQMMESLAIRRQSSEQFEKMKKLIDIWAKAETFSEPVLTDLRSTYFKEPYSTTPPGSPPTNWGGLPEDVDEVPKNDPPKPAPSADVLFGMLQTLAKSKPEGDKSKSPQTASASLNTNHNGAAPVTSAPEASNPAALLQNLASQSGNSYSAPADSDPRLAALQGAPMPAYQRGRAAQSSSSHERNRSRSPSRQTLEIPQPKTRVGDPTRNLDFDKSLLPDRVRVFSRTLYVGAIPDRYDEKDVRKDLEEVAPIQSIVYNAERHHAFVKVHCRKDADKVREGFEKMNREGNTVLRVKWGVGFGPRDCFDYYRGVSVIPLMRLTDADKKWSTSAEYGGTGGKALEAGLVMEEPDIEIGAGNLGSKNMQRQRMLQQQQQQQQQMMMMGGMASPMPGAIPSPMPGAIPGAIPGAVPSPLPGAAMPSPGAMPGAMPGMPFPMMPGYPMMNPGGADMQQFFAQMQQQMQQMQQQQQHHHQQPE